MPSNYNNAAPFYDRLSQVVFGNHLVKAQTYLLPRIPAGASVLIVGGGTGRLIRELGALKSGLQITYVELSQKMNALAAKRDAGNNQVNFINDAIENVALTQVFDVVITAFFFDSLNQRILGQAFEKIDSLLKPGGTWFNTDFQVTGKWWQKPLLQTMYLFFKVIGCADTTHLTEIGPMFSAKGYEVAEERLFYGDFIFTRAYLAP